jgi:alanine dehydrogenase
VIIDVSIDSGGCFENSELTSHEHPVFRKYDVIHYCVPNIPSGFARTASQAVSNVLMPLMLEISDEGGLENLIWHKFNIRNGIYLFKGASNQYSPESKVQPEVYRPELVDRFAAIIAISYLYSLGC